jgi:hypothetical protein
MNECGEDPSAQDELAAGNDEEIAALRYRNKI